MSTEESVRQDEPALLALIESLAAMTTSILIGIHFGTWMHVWIGFCFAPFLLMRTDESCEQAFWWYSDIWEFLVDKDEEGVRARLVWMLPFILWFLIGGLVVRIAATSTQIVKNPRACVRAIPINWWRIVIATDFGTSPEYLPHPHTPSSRLQWIDFDRAIQLFGKTYRTFGLMLNEALYGNGWKIKTFHWLALLLTFPLFLPLAITYRFSVKSTAIGWFPLLWALKGAKPSHSTWEATLKVDSDLKIPQFVAIWSTFCILLLGMKYGLWAFQYELASRADAWSEMFQEWAHAGGAWRSVAVSPLSNALVRIVRPGAIPVWHIAMFMNAILGVAIWWKIRTWLAQYRHNVPPSDANIEKTLSVIYFFRHLLVSYIIVCDGYLIWQVASRLPIPDIDPNLFPFS